MNLKKRLQAHALQVILHERQFQMQRWLRDRWAKLSPGKDGLTLWYQANDPYSRLSAQLLPDLRKNLQVPVKVRVIPMPDQQALPVPQLWRDYAARDAACIAPALRLDFPAKPSLPSEDKISLANQTLLASKNLDEFIALEAEVGAWLWSEESTQAAAHWPQASAQTAQKQLETNAAALKSAGHYQGGMWSFRGEWFWAVDRLDFLYQRLQCADVLSAGIEPPALNPLAARLPEPSCQDNQLDFYFSFRSPYSWLAIPPLRQFLTRHPQINLNIRPILPMVMRGHAIPRLKRWYIATDCARLAQRDSIPFGKIADPLGPAIEQLLAIFPLAESTQQQLDYLESASLACWVEGRDLGDPLVLQAVLARAGMPWKPARETLAAPLHLNFVETNRKALADLGIWGVPSYHIGNLSVWGQDRLWMVAEYLRRADSKAKPE